MSVQEARKYTSNRRIIVFTMLVALAMFPIAWLLHRKATQVQEDVVRYQDMEAAGEEEEIMEEDELPTERQLLENFVINRINVPLANGVASIDVYWNTNSDAYLLIKNLPPLAKGQRYQVWSMNGNDKKILGEYTAPVSGKLIVRSENALISNSYDISVIQDDIP